MTMPRWRQLTRMGLPFLLVAGCTKASLTVHGSTGAAAAASATPPATAPVASANATGTTPLPATFAELGLFTDGDISKPINGVTPYSVKVSLWSDTAAKSRFIYLPSGGQITVDPTSGQFNLPPGTTLIKHFARDAANTMPLETRVLRLQSDQTWAVATYQWLSATTTQSVSDVTMVTPGAGQANYRIPSPTECTYCHQGSQNVLGFQASELNFKRADGTNQLDALVAANVLSSSVAQSAKGVAAMVDPTDTTLTTDQRARSYLALNCGVCHNPSGVVTLFDLSSSLSLDALVGANYVVPGSPASSPLWQRFTATSDRMPLQSVVQDPLGLTLMTEWITNWPGGVTTAAAAGSATATGSGSGSTTPSTANDASTASTGGDSGTVANGSGTAASTGSGSGSVATVIAGGSGSGSGSGNADATGSGSGT